MKFYCLEHTAWPILSTYSAVMHMLGQCLVSKKWNLWGVGLHAPPHGKTLHTWAKHRHREHESMLCQNTIGGKRACVCVCVCARACVQAMYVCVRLCSHSRNNVYTTITLEVLVCGVGLALRTGMAFGSQKLRSKLQTKLRQWLFPENNCSPNIYEGYRWYIYIYISSYLDLL